MRVLVAVVVLVVSVSASGYTDPNTGDYTNSDTGDYGNVNPKFRNTGSSNVYTGGQNNADVFSNSGGDGSNQQVGTAQSGLTESADKKGTEESSHEDRKWSANDAGATRKDEQQRQGYSKENAYQKEDDSHKTKASEESQSFDTNNDWEKQSSQQQSDVDDKHYINLENTGKYNRQDYTSDELDKGISNDRQAHASQDTDTEHVQYGFNKDSGKNFKDEGGHKEVLSQDNSKLTLIQEHQKDARLNNRFLDAFKRSSDENRFNRLSDWESSAFQKQSVDSKFGNQDSLLNKAAQNNEDYNANDDSSQNTLWQKAGASDTAYRSAEDAAYKSADSQKHALAEADGQKKVADSKFYTGDAQTQPKVGYGTAGVNNVAGTGNFVSGTNPTGRTEKTGGDYVNQYWENANQKDQAQQSEDSSAKSAADAKNAYDRDDAQQAASENKNQQQGKWSKDQQGHRDASSQGYNANSADAAKSAQNGDKAQEQSLSSSSLEAANKNSVANEVDRINYRKEENVQDQSIKKQKKFYHNTAEDGYNNEGLHYDNDKGGSKWAKQEAAHNQARFASKNKADDAKVATHSRNFHNDDHRKISNSNAWSGERDNQNGWQNSQGQARDEADASKKQADSAREIHEDDAVSSDQQQRQQQLWDKANKDFYQRSHGLNKDRNLQAAFSFTPAKFQSGSRSGSGSHGSGNTGNYYDTKDTGFGNFMKPIGGSSFGDRFGKW